MPDDLLPEVDTTTPDAPAAEVADSESALDAVYDDTYDEVMEAEDNSDADAGDPTPKPDAKADDKPKPDEGEKGTEEQSKVIVSHSEQQALKRAKVPEAAWEHLSRDAIEQIVDQQRTIDRLQAESGRRTTEAQEPTEDQSKVEKPAQQAPPLSERVKGVFDKLAEVYDDDIREVGNLISELEERAGRFEQTANSVGPMGEILMNSVVDRFIDRLEQENPTASKPEVRRQIRERFMKEWKSGDYNLGEGENLYDLMGRVVSEAGRVTLAGATSEATAVANLVTQNKQRVRAQPKSGNAKAPPRAMTQDDIYDQAAQEFLTS